MGPRLQPRVTPGDAALGIHALPAPQAITDADVADCREQDAYLPIATVARIMRKSLPKEAKLSKSSRECVQECVSEFIAFVTSEAAERAHNERRRTLTGDDLLVAFNSLGFEKYGDVATIYLANYRIWVAAQQKKKSGSADRKRKVPRARDEEQEPGRYLVDDDEDDEEVKRSLDQGLKR